MASPLDRFMPAFDVRERFETLIEAAPDVVMRTAYDIDLQSLTPIRAIIRLRSLLMQGRGDREPRSPIGLVAETKALGWGTLVEERNRLLIRGACCQPWLGNVRFIALPTEKFAEYAGPDQIKIVWSLEAESLGPSRTRFAHEVRAVATDEAARRKFMRYWRWARFGIVAIRHILLPAIRRRAEATTSTGL